MKAPARVQPACTLGNSATVWVQSFSYHRTDAVFAPNNEQGLAMNDQINMLSDIELEAVAGGKKEQVTLEQYEQILAQMIKDNKNNRHGASGSW